MLQPGTYYAQVEELGRNAIAGYQIYITSWAQNVCGSGYLDAATEQCDDGNTASGDGCSATCQLEAAIAEVGSKYRQARRC